MSSVNLRNLSLGTYASSTTLWFYVTPHTRREIEGHTYWAYARDTVKPADWLFVTHTGPTPGNSIYAFTIDSPPRVRRLASTFGED